MQSRRAFALEELWKLAYEDIAALEGLAASMIDIGRSYGEGRKTTKVDLSIEGDGFLVLVEAKLYSPMSQADRDNDKPHKQIARKLTICIGTTTTVSPDRRAVMA